MKMGLISKIILLPIIIWGFLAVPNLNLGAEQGEVRKIIVVDPGHGGVDPGANRPGIEEKNINLAIALQIRDFLQKYNYKVIMTRDIDRELSDLCDNTRVRGRYHRDLYARLEAIQESQADLFVSIHANSNKNPKKHGIECYYGGKSQKGKELALAIQKQLETVVPICNRASSGDFFVLRRNKVPAVLIEVGFITNPREYQLLQEREYQQKIAKAVAEGIQLFYSN